MAGTENLDEACLEGEFVDRPETRSLITSLAHRSITIGLTGPRGAGKSELLKYAFNEKKEASQQSQPAGPGSTVGRFRTASAALSETTGSLNKAMLSMALSLPLVGDFALPILVRRLDRLTSEELSGLRDVDKRGPIVVPPFSTPTRYDERHFLQSLFEQIILAVRSRLVENEPRLDFPRFVGPRARLLTALGLVASGVFLLLQPDVIRNHMTEVFIIIGYPAAITIFLGLWVADNFINASVVVIHPLKSRLFNITTARLERLAFDQTFSASSTTEVGPVAGLKLGMSEGTELTRRPFTQVGLIQEIRRFCRDSLTVFEKIYIGIDELDKMHETEDVREFLRGVKGIFSIEGVCYVLTISEEAAAAFHLRNVSRRDEFDSSIRKTIRVGYLDTEQCGDLLVRRKVLLESPEVRLLSVISAGNPRELMRLALDYVEYSGGDKSPDLDRRLFRFFRQVVQAEGERLRLAVSERLVLGDDTRYKVGIAISGLLASSLGSTDKTGVDTYLEGILPSNPLTDEDVVTFLTAILTKDYPKFEQDFSSGRLERRTALEEVREAVRRFRIRVLLRDLLDSSLRDDLFESDEGAEQWRSVLERATSSVLDAEDEARKLFTAASSQHLRAVAMLLGGIKALQTELAGRAARATPPAGTPS